MLTEPGGLAVLGEKKRCQEIILTVRSTRGKADAFPGYLQGALLSRVLLHKSTVAQCLLLLWLENAAALSLL